MAEIRLEGGPLRFTEGLWRYPWADWLDGQPHVLVVGTDIPTARRFQSAAYRWGRRHGLTVVTRAGGKGTLVVQALPEMAR